MKTINEIKTESNLKNRAAVYYRIKISGIEEPEDYQPTYKRVNGKLVRVFPENESYIIINFKEKEEIRNERY